MAEGAVKEARLGVVALAVPAALGAGEVVLVATEKALADKEEVSVQEAEEAKAAEQAEATGCISVISVDERLWCCLGHK